MKWDDLRYLAALHKHQTMTAAARTLNSNVATVSRRVERFSNHIGQPAFVRTGSGWSATPAISGLLRLLEEFDGRLETELNAVQDAENRIELRIGAPPVIFGTVLFPRVADFQRSYKNAQLTFQNRIFEEGLGDCDIVIRFGMPNAGRLIVTKIGSISLRLYRHVDWAGSDWAGLSEDHDPYPPMQMARSVFSSAPVARVDDFNQLAILIDAAQLAGPLPERLAQRYPKLAPVDASGQQSLIADFHAMYHATRKGDPAIRATLDWISSCFSESSVSPPDDVRVSTPSR